VKCFVNQADFKIKFECEYPLYFGGKEIKEGVFVRLEVYNRRKNREAYMQLRIEIRKIYMQELQIPEEKIFIQFDDMFK